MIKNHISAGTILYPTGMLLLMWLGYLLQNLGFFQNCWGAIIPLVPSGLKGVFLSPLLHGSMDHLLSNSIPIFILLGLLFHFYPTVGRKILLGGWLFTGLLVWLLPPIDIFTGKYMYTCTIGASGVVYVLAFFLFFSGVFRWNMKLLTVSMVVALYYGSLVWGVLPEELFSGSDKPSNVSWQSHLAGATVGTIMAFAFKNAGERKKKYIWEFPNFYSEVDDKLWQNYREKHPEDFEDMPQKKRDEVWERLDELRDSRK